MRHQIIHALGPLVTAIRDHQQSIRNVTPEDECHKATHGRLVEALTAAFHSGLGPNFTESTRLAIEIVELAAKFPADVDRIVSGEQYPRSAPHHTLGECADIIEAAIRALESEGPP